MARLLRLAEVQQITALGRSTLYARVRLGTFPKPIPLGAARVAWIEDEVQAWIGAQVRAARPDITEPAALEAAVA
ncbi:MAG: AlpA family phage regulatory protein [Gemmatimonadetes bacterium]|nr:AlpA family phage regulatory protein [Gemmatimonadota bacterium]